MEYCIHYWPKKCYVAQKVTYVTPKIMGMVLELSSEKGGRRLAMMGIQIVDQILEELDQGGVPFET